MLALSTLNQLEHQMESQYMKRPVTVTFLYYLKLDSQECLQSVQKLFKNIGWLNQLQQLLLCFG